MNVYDKAYDLARALKESSEYKEWNQARGHVDADSDAKRMFEDFRSKQTQIQQKMMSGELPPQEELEQADKLFEIISVNPLIHQLFEAERRLSLILQDVHKIIAEPLQDLI